MRSKFIALAVLALLVALPAGAAAAEPGGGPVAPTGGVATPAPSAPAPPSEAVVTGVRQVAAGYYNGCALLVNRQVRCWGYGFYGENGDGTNDNGNTAVVVKNAAGTAPLTNVTQIAVGAYHACAVLTTREVRCWGWGQQYSLGNNSMDNHSLPVPVLNASGSGHLQNVLQVTAGSYNTCALLTNHQVRCWGQNDHGEAGNGTVGTDRPLPVAVRSVSGPGNLTDVTQIDAGYYSVCARLANGQVRCWGYNEYGTLGTGDTDDRHRPAVVRNPAGTGPLGNVTQVSNGEYNACARLANGQARCWGYASEGATGSGGNSSNPDRLRPVVVKNSNGSGPLTGVVGVGVGDYHACFLVATGGHVLCAGDNDYAELGNGTVGAPDRFLPKPVLDTSGVPSLTGATQLEAGNYHTCVRLSNGQARCWGYNEYGSVGDGTYDDQPQARKVIT